MSKISFFNKLSSISLAAICLTCSTAFAAANNNQSDNSLVPTDQINIFEKEDEEKAFDSHGFTRGDMTYLFKGKFDESKVESVSGEVENVLRVQYPDNDCYLIAIISTSGNKGRMALNLGPTWFLEEKEFSVNEGDEIQVKGAKMRTNGRFIMIVTELTMDGKTLNIRDKEGSPLWGSPKAQRGNADCMKLGNKKSTKNSQGSSH